MDEAKPSAELRRVFGRRVATAEQGQYCSPRVDVFLKLRETLLESRAAGPAPAGNLDSTGRGQACPAFGFIIGITERTPTVLFELNGDLMVADAEAVPLERYHPEHGKLDVPVIKGLDGYDASSFRAHAADNIARLRLGIRLLNELEAGSPALSHNISEMDCSDLTNVKVLLVDDTAEILLGDRDFLKRFETFMATLLGEVQKRSLLQGGGGQEDLQDVLGP